eukprot:COSAG04_NODE_735_length_10705_cov_33.479823_12_plen_54_part_00
MEAAPDAAPDAEDEDEEKVCRFCLCGEEEDDGPENGAQSAPAPLRCSVKSSLL